MTDQLRAALERTWRSAHAALHGLRQDADECEQPPCPMVRAALASATDEGPLSKFDIGGMTRAEQEGRPAVPALDVERLGAAWLNLWGGSSETPPSDVALLALHDLLSVFAREYAALQEQPE